MKAPPPIVLSNEQRVVVRRVLKRLHTRTFQTVGGYAGTGKTVVGTQLAEQRPDFGVCAFTGRAAAVLRHRGVARAQTIHSLIYKLADQEEGEARLPLFRLRTRAEIKCAGFLVDEASMVSRKLHVDLLSFGLPVVYIGDHGQLPPVGDDAGLMLEPDYRLETIHRNAGPIAHFAEHLRNGNSAVSWEGEGGRVRVWGKHEVTDRMLLRADQVIAAFNWRRRELNRHIRRLQGRADEVEVDDRLMCLRNDHRRGLFNGMQGVVTRVDHGEGLLDLEADNGTTFVAVPFDPDPEFMEEPRFRSDAPLPFAYAYAITAHKAQGGEWPRVLVFEQRCPMWEHRRWAYTAAARAKRRLDWVLPFQPYLRRTK